MQDVRYPIGRFVHEGTVSDAERESWIQDIAEAPRNMRLAIEGLESSQLNTPYRDGGWTVRQVVHHVPDSHMNAYIRMKLALTETEPVIKPYFENLWAELPDSLAAPELSLPLLECLHARWVLLLRSVNETQWHRTLRHPEMGLLRLDWTLGMYAWHGRHHVAHITALRERMNW